MRLGKDKKTVLIAVLLASAAYSSGQAGKNFKFLFKDNLAETNLAEGNNSVIINYSISELNIESTLTSAGSFYRISIPGHISSVVTGNPEIPVFSKLIVIPECTEYRIKISGVRSSRLHPGNKKINGFLFPAQEGGTKIQDLTKPDFKINRAIYASAGIIPADTVRLEPLGMVRNTKLANVYISPVRYNPHSNALEVISAMRIEISFSNVANSSSKTSYQISDYLKSSLDKGILNFNPDKVIRGYSDQPLKMIIITDTTFRNQLAPFIKWKIQKGFKMQVLYMGKSQAAGDYIHLKDTLSRIYSGSTASDPAPEYLLIIGDVNRVPYYGSGGTGNITDMYYGEFDGNGDYIPEMYIGRIPAADTTELKVAISKIIQYEKFQFADTNKFYSRAIASAGYDAGYANYMNGQVKYAIANYLTKDNNIDEYHFNYPESYTSKDSIIGLINKGISFMNYTGHGEALGWLHLNIKSPDIQLLNNKNKYPFIISNACRTSQFNLPTSFGTRMMLAPDKGAIGFIGCSNDSYWDEDFYWAVGNGTISANPTYDNTGLGAFDRMFHTHGESPSDWYFTMGQINYAGNLAVSASNSPRKKYYWETYNLVGDPSVIPIVGKPQHFNFSLPDTLPNNLRSLFLDVSPFAYVAVSHFDKLWDASFASNSGTVTLEMPGLSDDSCLIVVTGQNRIPVIKTVHFSKINKEFINLTSSTLNDMQGNNNGLADYGESLFLKLTVSNLGLTDSNNLYAKISTESNLVNISNDSVFIGTLSALSEVVLSDKIAFTVSNNVKDLEIITFKLLLKNNLYEKTYTIDICVHAPDLQIVSCTIDDKSSANGDNIPDPGETFNLVFKVRNQGSSNISGQFFISSKDNDLSIVEPSIKSGELKFNQITDIPLLVKLSETVPSGSQIDVSAILDCNPYIVNRDFNFRVGKVRESFEASSFNVFPWINISSVPWIVTSSENYDGYVSARSGPISHNGTSSLLIRTVYSNDDSVRFYYKVSSEPNYDNFSFRLNGAELLKKSGEINWARKSFAVKAGPNNMEWLYKKDNSVTQGSDCAWIDLIDFAQSSTVTYIAKDLQVARIIKPATSNRYGKETIKVKVLNLGKNILNGFNLAYEINNQFPPVMQHFDNQVIPFGDSVEVSFSTKADFSKYGIYKIVIYGLENNDDYLYNDTLKTRIENTIVNELLGVYPNPFTDKLNVSVYSQMQEKIHISIFSESGIKFYESEKEIFRGGNSFTISNFDFPPALYYLMVQGLTINKTIPVLKLKK